MAPPKSQSGRSKKNVNSSVNGRKKLSTGQNHKNANSERKDKIFIFSVIALGVLFGVCHSVYIATLFENSRHFSHLSIMEREMSFRTEMGLYFSYYKTMIESSNFMEGLNSIMNDNLTEYPDQINTLKRFNVYPEVLLSGAYRIYVNVMKYLNIPDKECWYVNRGENLPPIESCEGLGDPAYFYINCVWLMGGITVAVVFFYAVFLSKSILGGILAVLCFFYNHGECTRIQWTPPLRESFGYPVFLMQMFSVTHMLRQRQTDNLKYFHTSFLTFLFITFWQFAPFVLTTQLLAVFILYLFHFTNNKMITLYLLAITLGYLCSIVVLFFNPMLTTSLLTIFIPATFIVVKLESTMRVIKHRVIALVIQGALFLAVAFLVKTMTTHQKHDSHVWNLLRAKFTNYSDFHSSLYVCAIEFDFLERESVWKLTETFLLPMCIIIVIVVIGQIIHRENWKSVHLGAKHPETLSSTCEDCEIIFNALQLCAFTAMAVVIMRLKLFFTPQLCIMTSLICSKKFIQLNGKYKSIHQIIGIAVIALMSVQGILNIQSELSIIGEYNNPSMEELFLWVKSETPHDASFAGPMPTMANLMLSTRRPIVNHPHYEDSQLRERTKQVYSLFSRKPASQVHSTLKSLRVDFAILEDQWCYRGSRKGCSLLEVWDREDEKNLKGIPFCDQIKQNSSPFSVEFQNDIYTVIKL